MAGNRALRRLAFQALFQVDAQGSASRELLTAWLDGAEDAGSLSAKERDWVLTTAQAAFGARAAADAAFAKLAPSWPAHRQAAVDRAILRLAHYEMHAGQTPPKIVVNDAVELAKEFSTDRSPGFVNGLLDKILKELPAALPSPPPASPDSALGPRP